MQYSHTQFLEKSGVANSSDPFASTRNQLPPPDLNPLSNPVLEQNLGRWAQVYLNTPPEQRDQAVEALLRELKAEASAQGEAQPPTTSPFGTPRAPQPARASARTIEPSPRAPSDSDLEWLRSKNLALGHEYKESSPRWLWKVVAPVLALVVGVFLYSQWKTRLTAEQHPTASPAPVRGPATPRAPRPIAPQQPRAEASTVALTPTQTSQAPAVAAADKASNSSQEIGGSIELQRAQDYLVGRNGLPKDSSAAADWLWRAVRRENPAAGILLADLYVRGDGVPQNCEQARLLLMAAAKRGQSEAADKLRSLESGGCP